MDARRQEKLGWVGGWLGGFVWVLILGIMMLLRGDWVAGAGGLLIAAVAATTILVCSPWRHPRVKYRVLLAPVYSILIVALAWAAWALGNPRELGFNGWWSLLLVLPATLPLWLAGNRRWEDDDT